MKTINFHNPLNVVKGFYGGIISTNTNIKPKVGEGIVCTAKEDDFALGMVGRCRGEGTLEKGQEVFGPDCSSRIFLVASAACGWCCLPNNSTALDRFKITICLKGGPSL